MRAAVGWAAVLAVMLSVLPAHATTRRDARAARKAEHAGLRHEHRHKWKAAVEDYQRALQFHDTPGIRWHLAHAESELGHLIEAQKDLKAVLAAHHVSYWLRRNAKRKLRQIQKRIPSLTLILPHAFDGTVKVDQEPVDAAALNAPLSLNPGTHQLEVRAEHYRPLERTVSLKEREDQTLEVHLTRLAPPPELAAEPPAAPRVEKSSSLQTTLGIVSLGVGAAGLGVGIGMALAARATKNELSSTCVNNVCAESQRTLYDHGKTQADIATAGFIVGGAGVAAGIVLLLTAPKHEKSARLVPLVGPGSVGVAGRF